MSVRYYAFSPSLCYFYWKALLKEEYSSLLISIYFSRCITFSLSIWYRFWNESHLICKLYNCSPRYFSLFPRSTFMSFFSWRSSNSRAYLFFISSYEVNIAFIFSSNLSLRCTSSLKASSVNNNVASVTLFSAYNLWNWWASSVNFLFIRTMSTYDFYCSNIICSSLFTRASFISDMFLRCPSSTIL